MAGNGYNDTVSYDEKKHPVSVMTSNYAPPKEYQPCRLAPMNPKGGPLPSPLSPTFNRQSHHKLPTTSPGFLSSAASLLHLPHPPPYLGLPESPSPAFSNQSSPVFSNQPSPAFSRQSSPSFARQSSSSSFVALSSLKQDDHHPFDLQPPRIGQSPYGNANLNNGSTYSVYNYSTDWIPMQPPTPSNGGFGVSSSGLPITIEAQEADAAAMKKRRRLKMFFFCGVPVLAIIVALALGIVFGFLRLGRAAA